MKRPPSIREIRIVVYIVAAIVVTSVPYIFYRLYKVLVEIKMRYPTMGLDAGAIFVTWVASCFGVGWYFERRCRIKGPTAPRTRTNPAGESITNPRGYPAAVVYMMVTFPLLWQFMDWLYG